MKINQLMLNTTIPEKKNDWIPLVDHGMLLH